MEKFNEELSVCISSYLAKREDMVVLEVELSDELIGFLEQTAVEWSEQFGQKIDTGDVVGIILTRHIKALEKK